VKHTWTFSFNLIAASVTGRERVAYSVSTTWDDARLATYRRWMTWDSRQWSTGRLLMLLCVIIIIVITDACLWVCPPDDVCTSVWGRAADRNMQHWWVATV